MLWQNEPTIVIGRNQNTCDEINETYVRDMGIHVVRRNSGGGAVYHDLGNLNFSIIQSEEGDCSFSRFVQPIVNCLESYGIHVEYNGRNDLTIDGRKFSGNAQSFFGGKILHHGTILFAADLAILTKALKPLSETSQKKGVESVRSCVVNLNEYLDGIPFIDFKKRLIDTFFKDKKPVAYVPTDVDKMAIENIMHIKYLSHQWTFVDVQATCKDHVRTTVEGFGRGDIGIESVFYHEENY